MEEGGPQAFCKGGGCFKDPGGWGGCLGSWPAPADPPTHPPTPHHIFLRKNESKGPEI